MPLFRRKHRAIDLTTEGRAAVRGSHARAGRDRGCVAESARGNLRTPQITVAASVAFSYFWLMPRLETVRRHDIPKSICGCWRRIRGSTCARAMLMSQCCMATETGRALTTHRLFGERVYPVCSPGYLRDHPELAAPVRYSRSDASASGRRRQYLGRRRLAVWLAKQGVTGQPVRRGIRLNSYPMVLQAAEAGRGVALGWSYITDPMLAEERLVCPVEKASGDAGQLLRWCTSEAASQPGDRAISSMDHD